MNFIKDLWAAWKQARLRSKQKSRTFKRTKATSAMAEEKRKASELHEPWVGILRMDVDPENITDGCFELDWNDVFVARLVKKGYHGRNDQEIVEQWFNTVCQNVVAGFYEQAMADPEKRRQLQGTAIDYNQPDIS